MSPITIIAIPQASKVKSISICKAPYQSGHNFGPMGLLSLLDLASLDRGDGSKELVSFNTYLSSFGLCCVLTLFEFAMTHISKRNQET